MKQKSENGLFRVRKPNNQENQFVNLNHLKAGKKKYSSVWEIKECSEFSALFSLFSLYFILVASFLGNNLSADFERSLVMFTWLFGGLI